MTDHHHIKGDHNIVIQHVSDSTITVKVDGQSKEIANQLEAIQQLLTGMQTRLLRIEGRQYEVQHLGQENFDFIMSRVAVGEEVPDAWSEELYEEDESWVESLAHELTMHRGVSVGNKRWGIFQHYGWLIEAYLHKLSTQIGRGRNLRRLSFMAEAWQSSLRYLCYIQIVQILQANRAVELPLLTAFFDLPAADLPHYDYLNLLIVTTHFLGEEDTFMPEIFAFVEMVKDPEEDLSQTALYLDRYRSKLLAGELGDLEDLEQLLDQYLTGLVYWLCEISFVAEYRMVSVKDINLNYRMGTPRRFVHLYGELHGMYSEYFAEGEDYSKKALEDAFTFNQSVLLLKGANVDQSLEDIRKGGAYLSLSPLVIDQSVFSDKATQTPEIYCYSGRRGKHYGFDRYKNELSWEAGQRVPSNKYLEIQRKNRRYPQFDELYNHIVQVLKPLKVKRS